jgi:hypothetical protein
MIIRRQLSEAPQLVILKGEAKTSSLAAGNIVCMIPGIALSALLLVLEASISM